MSENAAASSASVNGGKSEVRGGICVSRLETKGSHFKLSLSRISEDLFFGRSDCFRIPLTVHESRMSKKWENTLHATQSLDAEIHGAG